MKKNYKLIKISLKGYPFTRFIPNIATLTGLCIGLTAVHYALMSQWEKSLWAVVIAMAFDGMDGRLARMFRASSRFGAELDSLSDFVTFGVSPALIAYLHSLHEWGNLGWGIVLFFCICSGLRLARFNTLSIEEEKDHLNSQESDKRFFIGVPMPIAGLFLLLPIMVAHDVGYALPTILYCIWGVVVGFLMVSKIPTYSFKNERIKPNYIVPILSLTSLVVIGMITRPWLTFPVMGFIYIGTFFFSYRQFHRLKKSNLDDLGSN